MLVLLSILLALVTALIVFIITSKNKNYDMGRKVTLDEDSTPLILAMLAGSSTLMLPVMIAMFTGTKWAFTDVFISSVIVVSLVSLKTVFHIATSIPGNAK